MLANLIYALALAALSPVIAYRALRHGRYRRGIFEKLSGLSERRAKTLRGDNGCIWIHAVSVGEVNLLDSIVSRLESESSTTSIAISTSTDTGYDLAVKKFGVERVFFCPLDFTWAVKRTLKNLQPAKLLLAELELWPNLIRIADQANCPVYVFNARLSKKSSAGYQKFGKLTRSTFTRLHWVGCQDSATASRFAACGTPRDRLQVTGSMKFDGAPTSRDTVEVMQRVRWAGIDPWHRVWLFGSSQPGEEVMAVDIYKRLRGEHPELRLIVVPRHPERFDQVARQIQFAGLTVHRRSEGKSLERSSWDSDAVTLIDTIGELTHWWGVCQIATVGGSFGDRGGQNMLEPAGYGCAVSFGPNTMNFAQIADELLNAEGAVRVADESELQDFVRRCLVDVPASDRLGRNARSTIERFRGGTEATLKVLAATSPTVERRGRVAA